MQVSCFTRLVSKFNTIYRYSPARYVSAYGSADVSWWGRGFWHARGRIYTNTWWRTKSFQRTGNAAECRYAWRPWWRICRPRTGCVCIMFYTSQPLRAKLRLLTALPVRPASPLPPNVPTGPRNKNKYKDIDGSAPAVDGLDYGGGKDRTTPPDHDDRGSGR